MTLIFNHSDLMASYIFQLLLLRREIKIQSNHVRGTIAKIIASENPITEFMLAAAPIITKSKNKNLYVYSICFTSSK